MRCRRWLFFKCVCICLCVRVRVSPYTGMCYVFFLLIVICQNRCKKCCWYFCFVYDRTTYHFNIKVVIFAISFHEFILILKYFPSCNDSIAVFIAPDLYKCKFPPKVKCKVREYENGMNVGTLTCRADLRIVYVFLKMNTNDKSKQSINIRVLNYSNCV